MTSKKIFIIGDFGYATNSIGGQTIKTRNIHEVLKEEYDVTFYDTGNIKGNKVSLLNLVFSALKYKNIFFIGGKKNLKYFFPLLFLISKIKKSNVVYVTVGGWLYDFLKSSPTIYTFMVKNIKSVLVETNHLENELAGLGLNNVSWIPNFRMISNCRITEVRANSENFRVVFMARITSSKGIYLLFDFIEEYLKNADRFRKTVTIHFYGPISPEDEIKFKKLVDKHSVHVIYKGILEPSEIYQILPSYDVLILPTFHEGEGFPGSILDAYLCSLPVITTRWKQLPEFIDDNESGFLIDYDVNDLFSKVQQLTNDTELLSMMKRRAYEKSKQYSAEVGLKALKKAMGF